MPIVKWTAALKEYEWLLFLSKKKIFHFVLDYAKIGINDSLIQTLGHWKSELPFMSTSAQDSFS